MRYLLDSDCCIYLMVGSHPVLTARVADCADGDLAMSAISLAEVAHGVAATKPPGAAVLAAFSAAIPVLPFDEHVARTYATMPFRRGRFDRLIAAHALARGLTLVTNNLADFADVPGLRIENWTVPA